MHFSFLLKAIHILAALIIIKNERVENKQYNVIIKWMFRDYQFPLLLTTKIEKNIDADYKVKTNFIYFIV